MAHSTRTLRIVAASALALIMIGSAYALSGPLPFWNVVEAQSAEELLREYAARDSDSDGLPDWQEALYGTDPHNPESFQAGMLDGEAVAQGLIEPRVLVRPEGEPTDPESIPGTNAGPNSLTDRFAQAILTQYLQNRGTNRPTQAEIMSFVESAVSELSLTSSHPNRFTMQDVLNAPSGHDGLAAYAANAERAFRENASPAGKNELLYFSDALKGQTGAVSSIELISANYEAVANALIKVPVPPEARQAHLGLANALMQLSEVSADMASIETDPLRALMGIGLYEKYAQAWIAALSNMSAVFAAQQVVIPPSELGGSFVETSNAAKAASTVQ